jgi:hypothetical protein
MHWMSQTTPPQVTDRTRGRRSSTTGSRSRSAGGAARSPARLFWTPLPGGGPPLGAIFAGAAIIIALCILVAVVRHRRRGAEERPAAEAW